jgi:hypothetical protein
MPCSRSSRALDVPGASQGVGDGGGSRPTAYRGPGEFGPHAGAHARSLADHGLGHRCCIGGHMPVALGITLAGRHAQTLPGTLSVGGAKLPPVGQARGFFDVPYPVSGHRRAGPFRNDSRIRLAPAPTLARLTNAHADPHDPRSHSYVMVCPITVHGTWAHMSTHMHTEMHRHTIGVSRLPWHCLGKVVRGQMSWAGCSSLLHSG